MKALAMANQTRARPRRRDPTATQAGYPSLPRRPGRPVRAANVAPELRERIAADMRPLRPTPPSSRA